jgi:DNA-binding MarR family transcriptional regulator
MTLDDIYAAPGHLMRRSQQIAVAIFFEEMRGFDVTPVQYAALVAIQSHPGIDQRTLVDLIAIDRSTIGVMLRRLEERGLLARVTPRHNQRIKQLFIAPAGRALLEAARGAIDKSQERILAPLSPRERATFMSLLARLVDINNSLSRAPLRRERQRDAYGPS